MLSHEGYGMPKRPVSVWRSVTISVRGPMIAALAEQELPFVELVGESREELRFRVTNAAHADALDPFDVVFEDPETFDGPRELEDVYLRSSPTSPGASVEHPGKARYEFVCREIVPTDGRPSQVHVLSPDEVRVLHGAFAWTVVARVIARDVRVEPGRGHVMLDGAPVIAGLSFVCWKRRTKLAYTFAHGRERAAASRRLPRAFEGGAWLLPVGRGSPRCRARRVRGGARSRGS